MECAVNVYRLSEQSGPLLPPLPIIKVLRRFFWVFYYSKHGTQSTMMHFQGIVVYSLFKVKMSYKEQFTRTIFLFFSLLASYIHSSYHFWSLLLGSLTNVFQSYIYLSLWVSIPCSLTYTWTHKNSFHLSFTDMYLIPRAIHAVLSNSTTPPPKSERGKQKEWKYARDKTEETLRKKM